MSYASKLVAIRIPHHLHARVCEIAEEDDRSFSSYVRHLLQTQVNLRDATASGS